MTFVVAGMFGLGGPEVMALLVLSLVVVVIVKIGKKPAQFSRFCPKCGRGLIQAADAPFCSYCGTRLP